MRGSGVLRCPSCRQWQDSFTRTGETREATHRVRGGWRGGSRTVTKHEVICGRCGHRWWSQNIDAARLPLSPEPPRPDGREVVG